MLCLLKQNGSPYISLSHNFLKIRFVLEFIISKSFSPEFSSLGPQLACSPGICRFTIDLWGTNSKFRIHWEGIFKKNQLSTFGNKLIHSRIQWKRISEKRNPFWHSFSISTKAQFLKSLSSLLPITNFSFVTQRRVSVWYETFGQNLDFQAQLRLLDKIEIFRHNWDFRAKLRLL